MVTSKRMSRRILSLQDDYGNWQGDQECLLNMAMKYFGDIYQSYQPSLPVFNWESLGLVGLNQKHISRLN